MLNGSKINNDIEERIRMYRIPVQSKYKRRRRQKPKNKFPKFLFFIGIVLALVFVVANHQINIGFDVNKTGIHSPIDLNFNFSPRRQNILLMGIFHFYTL